LELSFVLSALRRRFWVVSLFALLGALPGLLADPPTSTRFQSSGALIIQQPTQGNIGFFTSDPDRYVISQLSVLESARLVAEVAALNNITPIEVRDAVEIEHLPETDVVEITAVFDNDAAVARGIVQGYIDSYMATLATDLSDEDELQRLDREINVLTNRLSALNTRIQEAMAPHLARLSRTNPPPIPPVEAVDPAAVTEKNLAEAELRGLIADKNALISDSRLRVNTVVIQRATTPTDPVEAAGEFLTAGGLLAGIMLGVVAALAWARFSTKVLDEDTASEILAAPVVSELPHYRSLARQPLAAFQALPRSAVPVIDQLCVLAEAKARIDQPLAVVAVGTQRGAGATTLALAMADRFAAGGSSVVLVDADVRDPRITAIFNATGDGGVPAVVANEGALIDQRGRSVFTRTMDPEVSVLGLGANRGAASLRRDTVASVLEAARRKAQVVVIDGGPALDLASTLQVTALADAVVLAVPLSRQKTDALADLSRQLTPAREKLLPVVTAPSRRPARGEIVGNDGSISGSAPAMNNLSNEPRPPATVGSPLEGSPSTAGSAERETMMFGTEWSGSSDE
jgi:Mrp family chromosome partitioning ATPase